MILVVEDDPDLRELLGELLRSEGHSVTTAADGPSSLKLLAHCAPDLLLLDYNLPNGPNGLDLASEIRRRTGRDIPVVLLTGDISSVTLGAAVQHGYTQLNKPVKRWELMQVISQALPKAQTGPATPTNSARPTVFVVDDDDSVRGAIVEMLSEDGQVARGFPTSEAFLQSYQPGGEACLLVDAYLPGLDGIGLLDHLRTSGQPLPAIMITGQSDVPMAVRAMKAGASDFIEKPVSRADLLASVGRALEQARDSTKRTAWRAEAAAQVAALTARQRQIMMLVVAGHPSKNIAADLGISQRTVENHRASIMHKTGSASVPALARLALAAGYVDADLTTVMPSPAA
jgi:two-component system CheB/CheR fusion protein